MKINLSQPLGRSSPADPNDVRQMKKALNRLGYYMPFEKIGITEVTDDALFDALKNFQRDQGLSATGAAKPDDETIQHLNKLSEKEPDGFYIWRTVEDGKVRTAHAQYNRAIRAWRDAPAPGDDFNCRCWAEPIAPITSKSVDHIYDPPIEPVYPELLFLPWLRAGRVGWVKALKTIKAFQKPRKETGYTQHGKARSDQRNISTKDIESAIKSAQKSGNIKTKTGKYGTEQKVYSGDNGVKVVIETTGKNADKIITTWRE